jgi:hypothetical protein
MKSLDLPALQAWGSQTTFYLSNSMNLYIPKLTEQTCGISINNKRCMDDVIVSVFRPDMLKGLLG